jgi:nicotinamidase-related amidase
MDNLALMIIDMQEYFLENVSIDRRMPMIESQRNVIDYFMDKKAPIILVEMKFKSQNMGETIPLIKDKVCNYEHALYLNKSVCNALEVPEISEKVSGLEAKTLVIAGVYASRCVNETAMRASLKYKVHVADDIIAMSDLAIKSYQGFERRKRLFKAQFIIDDDLFGNPKNITYHKNHKELIDALDSKEKPRTNKNIFSMLW